MLGAGHLVRGLFADDGRHDSFTGQGTLHKDHLLITPGHTTGVLIEGLDLICFKRIHELIATLLSRLANAQPGFVLRSRAPSLFRGHRLVNRFHL